MVKVLLVYPNVRHESLVPPSLALLSRILKNEGIIVDIFDSTDYQIDLGMVDPDRMRMKNLQVIPLAAIHRESKGDVHAGFRKKVSEFSPDLIAVTSTESTFLLATSLLSALGGKRPPTVLGGVFATFAPKLVLRYPEIDMLVRGEGEVSLPMLAKAIGRGEDYSKVPGLSFKKEDGSIVENPMPYNTDINNNPTDLDISLFDNHRLVRPMGPRRWKMLAVETHRGCPYPCGFCNSPSQNRLSDANGIGKFFRKKRPEKVKEELDYYIKNYGIDFAFFWADTFFAYSPKEFDEFLEMYKDIKGPDGKPLPFWCQTRAETVMVDKKRVKQLKDVGLYWISFGLEHGNEKFRADVINRRCTNEIMIDAFRTVNEEGVPLTVNNIIGFPYETRELVFDTIELNRQFHANSRSASIFMPYQGTALHALSLKEGFIEDDTICPSNNERAVMNMSTMTKDEIMGLSQTFAFYVAFPKDRWGEIRHAEAQTPEGERIRGLLRAEWIEKYMPAAYPLLDTPTVENAESTAYAN